MWGIGGPSRMTRRVHYVLVLVGVLLAGCAGGTSSAPADSTASPSGTADPTTESPMTGAETGTETGSGTVDFYISDEENAIGDFEHVNVTATAVGFQRGGESGGWVEHDVNNVTVDLTELQGPKSAHVDTYDLPNGKYSKVFIDVDDVQATLENGEEVRVKLASGMLQLEENFALENGSEIDFVFDITVKKAGNSGKYVLQPVITESGTDVPIESTNEEDGDEEENEVDSDEDDNGDEDGSEEVDGSDEEESDLSLEATVEGNVTANENVTLVVTRNDTPIENASVTVNDGLVGTTDADGELTLTIPAADTLTVVIGVDDAELELEYEIEADDES